MYNIISYYSTAEDFFCDPPCGENRVCQNFTGVAECVCVGGFAGEDNCTGEPLPYFLKTKARQESS